MGTAGPITVLGADDHPTTREGLALILDNEDGLGVVAQAGDGEEAVEQYRRHRPDVVLMDLHMPRMGGVGATEAIRAEFPDARVLLLTTYDGDEDIHRGLRAGAMAFLLKDTPVEDVLRAVRAIHEGGTYVCGSVGARLANALRTPRLTPREADVLCCVAEGLSNQGRGKTARHQGGHGEEPSQWRGGEAGCYEPHRDRAAGSPARLAAPVEGQIPLSYGQ